MKTRFAIFSVCLCMASAVAFAAPKDKPRKGNPKDQAVMDYVAPFVDDASMRIDGNVEDWNGVTPIEFQTLIAGEYEYDWTGPKDLSASMMAQYGASKAYFMVSVKDNAVVSKKKQWKSDRVELWLGMEDGQGRAIGTVRGILLDIGPQVDGGNAAVKFLSGRQGGLSAVGFVAPDGYDFEIAVDYEALGKESPVMGGALRFCVVVRDWDQDDPNEDEAVIATCPVNPKKTSSLKRAQMGKIPLKLDEELWRNVLLSDRSLSQTASPWTRAWGDLGGSKLPEMIAVSGEKLVVAGMDLFRPGASWFTLELPASMPDAPKISFKDVNGDGRNELVLQRKEHCANIAAHALRTYVFALSESTLKFVASFLDEQRSDDGSAFVRNTYVFKKNGVAQSLDPKSSGDMAACALSGMDNTMPMIYPDGGEKTRTVPY